MLYNNHNNNHFVLVFEGFFKYLPSVCMQADVTST